MGGDWPDRFLSITRLYSSDICQLYLVVPVPCILRVTSFVLLLPFEVMLSDSLLIALVTPVCTGCLLSGLLPMIALLFGAIHDFEVIVWLCSLDRSVLPSRLFGFSRLYLIRRRR